jgi:hypothetical protein
VQAVIAAGAREVDWVTQEFGGDGTKNFQKSMICP